ncbi:MAG: hypothetical protein AB7O43_11250 [Hyphomicrobiaceae bacterium]
MPRKTTKPHPLNLPNIVPGAWNGELVGGVSVSLGQVVQKRSPPLSVEFSQIVASVALAMPDGRFTWPGVLFVMAPTPMKPESSEAGVLFKSNPLPALCLSLDVTRAQFSDLLRSFEAKRIKRFHFTVAEIRGKSWPVTSWGASIRLERT